jgi:hypothetical protein
MMVPRVVEAAYVRDFLLRLRFRDGTEGEIDLAGELDGEIFAPLKDLEYFKRFSVSPDLHTVVWPNGADFAPEFLYEKVQIPA